MDKSSRTFEESLKNFGFKMQHFKDALSKAQEEYDKEEKEKIKNMNEVSAEGKHVKDETLSDDMVQTNTPTQIIFETPVNPFQP